MLRLIRQFQKSIFSTTGLDALGRHDKVIGHGRLPAEGSRVHECSRESMGSWLLSKQKRAPEDESLKNALASGSEPGTSHMQWTGKGALVHIMGANEERREKTNSMLRCCEHEKRRKQGDIDTIANSLSPPVTASSWAALGLDKNEREAQLTFCQRLRPPLVVRASSV